MVNGATPGPQFGPKVTVPVTLIALMPRRPAHAAANPGGVLRVTLACPANDPVATPLIALLGYHRFPFHRISVSPNGGATEAVAQLSGLRAYNATNVPEEICGADTPLVVQQKFPLVVQPDATPVTRVRTAVPSLAVSRGWKLSLAEKVHVIPPSMGVPVAWRLACDVAEAGDEVSVNRATALTNATIKRWKHHLGAVTVLSRRSSRMAHLPRSRAETLTAGRVRRAEADPGAARSPNPRRHC